MYNSILLYNVDLDISCGDPGYGINADREGNSFSFTDNLVYSCKKGHTASVKSFTITCEYDGSWSDLPLTCQGIG